MMMIMETHLAKSNCECSKRVDDACEMKDRLTSLDMSRCSNFDVRHVHTEAGEGEGLVSEAPGNKCNNQPNLQDLQ